MSTSSLSLAGQVAIVTGAKSGTGKDTALILAEAGADVIVCDAVADSELTALENEIRKLGRRVMSFECDVANQAGFARMMRQAVDRFGKIDILVNSEGIAIPEAPAEPQRYYRTQKQTRAADTVLVVPGVSSCYYWSDNWFR